MNFLVSLKTTGQLDLKYLEKFCICINVLMLVLGNFPDYELSLPHFLLKLWQEVRETNQNQRHLASQSYLIVFNKAALEISWNCIKIN